MNDVLLLVFLTCIMYFLSRGLNRILNIGPIMEATNKTAEPYLHSYSSTWVWKNWFGDLWTKVFLDGWRQRRLFEKFKCMSLFLLGLKSEEDGEINCICDSHLNFCIHESSNINSCNVEAIWYLRCHISVFDPINQLRLIKRLI